MPDGLIMNFALGEGSIQGELKLIMDTTVATTVPVTATADAVMSSLSIAQSAIHTMFFELIKPIQNLMDIK